MPTRPACPEIRRQDKDKWLCEACSCETAVKIHCCTTRCKGRGLCRDCFESPAHPCFVEAEKEKA